MFTGIIEDIGKIKEIRKISGKILISVYSEFITKNINIGDSVSINGVCQTVVKKDNNIFYVEAVGSTLVKTTFKYLRKGNYVNLERSLRSGSGFDGHIVQGHVNSIGTIRSIIQKTSSCYLKIKVNRSILKYIVSEGSITIDGVSLTVSNIEINSIVLSIIPHTFNNTILKYKKNGDIVNIETDIIAKYVFKTAKNSVVHLKMLEECGF